MKTAIQWPGASGTGRTTYPSGTFPRKDSSSSAHSRDGSGPVISLIGDTPQVYRYFLREAPHCLSPRRKSRPQARTALEPGQALPFKIVTNFRRADMNRRRSCPGPAAAVRGPRWEGPPGRRRRPGWLMVSPDRGQIRLRGWRPPNPIWRLSAPRYVGVKPLSNAGEVAAQ